MNPKPKLTWNENMILLCGGNELSRIEKHEHGFCVNIEGRVHAFYVDTPMEYEPVLVEAKKFCEDDARLLFETYEYEQ
jgi:hypothetical protein